MAYSHPGLHLTLNFIPNLEMSYLPLGAHFLSLRAARIRRQYILESYNHIYKIIWIVDIYAELHIVCGIFPKAVGDGIETFRPPVGVAGCGCAVEP